MTKPIEILHLNFDTKLETIKNIICVLVPKYEPFTKVEESKEILQAIGLFEKVHKEYNESVANVLCDYFTTSDAKEKCRLVETYQQNVIGHDYLTMLNTCVTLLKEQALALKKVDVNMQLLFKKYAQAAWDGAAHKIDYKICPDCTSKMTVYPYSSEMRCSKCPFNQVLKGTMFDESQMYTQDGNLSKRGSYETSKHCKYHLERILAIKNPNIPQRVWDKIDKWILVNNIEYPKLMTCPNYRRCLKDIKETKYNEHVPFIRHNKSGVAPDRLFHTESRLVYIYFDKAVRAFDKVKTDESNLKYYPYFIFKIIEMILHAPEDKKRRQSIIDCIHFQRDNTIVANDKLWEKICEKVPEFEFKKTDRNMIHSI